MKKQTKSRDTADRSLGEVRIIAGKWKGRKLPVLSAQGLRPTTDRVRETLFNWLQFDIRGLRCLDPFAGSGALSLEALSRGASRSRMIELNPQAAELLKKNLAVLGCADAEVVLGDALAYLSQPNRENPYGLVFLDPPFGKDFLEKTCRLLETGGYLCDGCFVYLERRADETADVPGNWELLRDKTAGQVRYCLFRRKQMSVSE